MNARRISDEREGGKRRRKENLQPITQRLARTLKKSWEVDHAGLTEPSDRGDVSLDKAVFEKGRREDEGVERRVQGGNGGGRGQAGAGKEEEAPQPLLDEGEEEEARWIKEREDLIDDVVGEDVHEGGGEARRGEKQGERVGMVPAARVPESRTGQEFILKG